ncbi:hypothetical protein V6N13_149108 [Hibiscus sabdariffa]
MKARSNSMPLSEKGVVHIFPIDKTKVAQKIQRCAVQMSFLFVFLSLILRRLEDESSPVLLFSEMRWMLIFIVSNVQSND